MYEAVYAYPDGESTAARFADTASRYGYEGVVVRAREATPDYETIRDGMDADIVDGVEVVADTPDQASGGIGNYRPKTTLLLLRGGTNALNRFAVEQERIDVLTQPMRDDGDFNHVLARAARKNNVHVEFDFGPVLRLDGGHRVQAIRNLRKLRELVEQYDAPYVVSATPASHLQLRAPRELAALGETIGFSADQIRHGLTQWRRIAERNRRLASESFIAPGVERTSHEEDA